MFELFPVQCAQEILARSSVPICADRLLLQGRPSHTNQEIVQFISGQQFLGKISKFIHSIYIDLLTIATGSVKAENRTNQVPFY